MGLKLHLTWFEQKNDKFVGEEYSKDFGDDDSLIDVLGLPLDDTMNNGEFNVKDEWVTFLQPSFTHKISTQQFDYFISFNYRDKW